MKFGIFDYIDWRDEPLAKIFDDRMVLLRAAEALPPEAAMLRRLLPVVGVIDVTAGTGAM